MTKDLINRITYHLSSGGLFNPELADHLAVRNLLMECREALAQPEQEPVAYQDTAKHSELVAAEDWENIDPQWHWMYRPLYTAPHRKPLTNKEIGAILDDPNIAEKHQGNWLVLPYSYARAIEAAHGIKENT